MKYVRDCLELERSPFPPEDRKFPLQLLVADIALRNMLGRQLGNEDVLRRFRYLSGSAPVKCMPRHAMMYSVMRLINDMWEHAPRFDRGVFSFPVRPFFHSLCPCFFLSLSLSLSLPLSLSLSLFLSLSLASSLSHTRTHPLSKRLLHQRPSFMPEPLRFRHLLAYVVKT